MSEIILVTGATGFVGSCVVRRLVRLGHKISIICRNKNLNWRLQDIASKLDIHTIDIRDPNLISEIKKIRPTIVFHLAAYGTSLKENDVDKLIDINIKGLINLIEAVKNVPLKLFVNTGSSSEYGTKKNSMKETDTLEPINDYGVTKSAMTLFSQKIALTEHIPIVTFRLFSPYGFFEDKERFIPTVISHMLKNERLELSSPTFVRDFIFVDDVVDAYVHSIAKSFPFGTIVNIGSGEEHNLREVVELVRRLTISTTHVAWNVKKLQIRQVEPRHWQADIKLAKSLLNWKPMYTLEEGLRKTIDLMRNNKGYYT